MKATWLDLLVAAGLIGAMVWLVGLPERLDGRFRLVRVVDEPALRPGAGFAVTYRGALAWSEAVPGLYEFPQTEPRHLVPLATSPALGGMADCRLSAAPNGVAFVAACDTGQVYRIDDQTTQHVASLPVTGIEQFAVDAGGRLYVVVRDRRAEVVCYARDGRELRRFGGQGHGAPLATGAGQMHVNGRMLMVLEPATASLWHWAIDEADPEPSRWLLGSEAVTLFCPTAGGVYYCDGRRIVEARSGEWAERTVLRLPRGVAVQAMAAPYHQLSLLVANDGATELRHYRQWHIDRGYP